MSIKVLVDFHFEGDGASRLYETMKERLPHSRTSEGCEGIDLYVDQEDANHLVLLEQWATKEHYEKYLEWAMSQPGTDRMMDKLVRPMSVVFLEKTDA